MMPSDVFVEARVKAQTQLAQDKLGWFGTVFIIAAVIGIGLVLYFGSNRDTTSLRKKLTFCRNRRRLPSRISRYAQRSLR